MKIYTVAVTRVTTYETFAHSAEEAVDIVLNGGDHDDCEIDQVTTNAMVVEVGRSDMRIHAKKLKGWKVTSLGLSVFASEPARVYYAPGSWTVPNKGCGPLCVFATKEIAQKFARHISNAEVRECLYIPSKRIFAREPLMTNSIESYRTYLITMPPGTVLATRVMVLS